MNPHDRVIVVGAGAAGTSAATELRRLGLTGPITIVNGEHVAPYNRTTVNKVLLQPDASLSSVRQAHPEDDATFLLTGTAAGSLDLDARTLLLQDGTRLGYDAVLVATGARPRTLGVPVPRAITNRVTTLRTAEDAARIRDLLDRRRQAGRQARVVIAGAGLLGSETADALTEMGHRVCLVDPSPAPLRRLLGATVADWVHDQHARRLDAVLEDRIVAVDEQDDDAGFLVRTRSGTEVAADVLVAVVGVTPDVAWLGGSGLDAVDGIATDQHLRVRGAPGVYAAGDVARVDGRPAGEHWGQALAQGAHAARVIAFDLGIADDPGPLVPTASFTTRLYGRPIAVLGAVGPGGDVVELLDDPDAGLHVSAVSDDAGGLTGVVAMGSLKLANKLRPLVAAHAPLAEAVGLLDQLGMSPAVAPVARS